MVKKWVRVITYLLLNGVYWGYNPLTNLLLTAWDILVSTLEGKLRMIWMNFCLTSIYRRN